MNAKPFNILKKILSSTLAVSMTLASIGMVPALADSPVNTAVPAAIESLPQSDTASVSADKEALTDTIIQGTNTDLTHITTSLINPLPTISPNGSTVTWVSSDYTVVSNDGQTVVRPAHGAGDVTVPLFATIKKGSITDMKTFTLKVLEMPSKVATISSIGAYEVSAHGMASENIMNVPFGTTKAKFLAGIAKDEPNQTLNDAGIQDPVVTGDKLVVTAQDATTITTYTITTYGAAKITKAPANIIKPVVHIPRNAPKPLPEKVATPFVDVQEHWAYDYIETMRLQGIIDGIGKDTFGPDLNITRGELVKIAMVAYGKTIPKHLKVKSFSDVEVTDCYAPYIEAAKNVRFIKGYKDGTFRPNEMISRGDALKILLLASRKRIAPAPDAAFKDTNDHTWYSSYLDFAKAHDMIIGYKDDTFRPDQLATRAEFLKMLVKVMMLK